MTENIFPYNMSLIDWAGKFKVLYENNDQHRHPEDFWTGVMAHLSVVGEAIRKTDYRELLEAAAHAFCWMSGYVTKCNTGEDPLFKIDHSLAEMVALKFPWKCGHCGEKTCKCHPVKMDEANDKAAKYRELFSDWSMPINWGDWTFRHFIDMFWKIYGGKIHLQTLENIGFHLLEEAGEEAKAVRQLVGLRGITKQNFDGINDEYINNLSSIPNIVDEYENSIKFLKSNYNQASEAQAKKSIDYTSNLPGVLKARLCLSKMDFVIELADTFSWLCAVLLKVEKTLERLDSKLYDELKIENYLHKTYKIDDTNSDAICYACEKSSCRCLFFPLIVKP